MNILLKGGRVIDPASGLDAVANVLIKDGRIVAVGPALPAADVACLDVTGLVVAPGLIDMHVHLREPGLEAKEDIYSGTRAAAAGGFTTVLCMPNTQPVLDNAATVRGVQQQAAAVAAVRLQVAGALTKEQAGRELAEIGDMAQTGIKAVSDDGHFVTSAQVMRTGLEYSTMFGLPVIAHCEETTLVEDGLMHEGAVSAALGMRGRPAVAEDIAVARDIMLAEYTGARLHIAHVSTAGAVALIRAAKQRGVAVTAEATPHHLILTDAAVRDFSSVAKVNPPLRSEEHVTALRQALRDGVIDAIATDHAPHAWEEKDTTFRDAPNGFPGLETALGVLLTHLYHTGFMTLPEIIARLTAVPARILGLSAGTLAPGNAADVTVIDPAREWTVEPARFYSKCKLSPWAGQTLRGQAVLCLVGGRVIMREGEVLV